MLCRLAVCLAAAFGAAAQQIEVPRPLPASMPVLAERVLAAGGAQAADDRFRLQIAAGRYDDALKSLAEAHSTANVRWEIYANAKRIEAADKRPFSDAFAQSFRETMARLDDNLAYRVLWSFGASPQFLTSSFNDALSRQQNAATISITDARDLVRKYMGAHAFEELTPRLKALVEEDDERRYVVARDVAVKTPDGATVCAVIVRPRTDLRRPALLTFTIYAEPDTNFDEARRAASNGFAGIVGLTRGKGCSPDTPAPYEHDGADAAALIDWIAAQEWSDGRVGIYGGSYNGQTAWAAAKRMPKALKGIMTGAPVGPGVDVPMEGNVFWTFVYPWTFYTTNNKLLDNATYNDNDRWQKLDRESYVSGRAFRDREKIDGTPNPIFARWIAHPSYDSYWQKMIPYKDDFARIGIPVLTTAGYYFGGPGAAVHYFTEHYKQRPDAEHYLLIGPWDHVRGHSGTISPLGTKSTTSISGYEVEPVAHVDMPELRYEWFNYVFGRGPRPSMLQDKVNYEVMGANRWAHAPSLAAMSTRKMRIALPAETLTVNFADRTDVDREVPGGNIIDKAIDVANAVKVVSDPVDKPTEVAGLFSGHLEFITNKKDFDFQVTLYELTASGEYVLLAPYWSRASYNGHPEVRKLLAPGKRQRLDFTSIRLIGRQMQSGSRIVAVVGIIKEPGRQLNLGSGKDVSDETIADAGAPLRVSWLRGSYISVPVRD
jgi:predicted acyl esterase